MKLFAFLYSLAFVASTASASFLRASPNNHTHVSRHLGSSQKSECIAKVGSRCDFYKVSSWNSKKFCAWTKGEVNTYCPSGFTLVRADCPVPSKLRKIDDWVLTHNDANNNQYTNSDVYANGGGCYYGRATGGVSCVTRSYHSVVYCRRTSNRVVTGEETIEKYYENIEGDGMGEEADAKDTSCPDGKIIKEAWTTYYAMPGYGPLSTSTQCDDAKPKWNSERTATTQYKCSDGDKFKYRVKITCVDNDDAQERHEQCLVGDDSTCVGTRVCNRNTATCDSRGHGDGYLHNCNIEAHCPHSWTTCSMGACRKKSGNSCGYNYNCASNNCSNGKCT